MAKTNWSITNQLKEYFKKNKLSVNQDFTNRQQRTICKENNISSFQFVEFVLYGEVTYKERKQDYEN